jgi:hypothetical protein
VHAPHGCDEKVCRQLQAYFTSPNVSFAFRWRYRARPFSSVCGALQL